MKFRITLIDAESNYYDVNYKVITIPEKPKGTSKFVGIFRTEKEAIKAAKKYKEMKDKINAYYKELQI
jgi:hypothetical protein